MGKTKKSSLNIFNNLFNDDTKHTSKYTSFQHSKKTNKYTQKQHIPRLTNISLKVLQKIYNLDLYKDTITSFYALNNPIITYLVKYNDNDSKRLIKNGGSNLELVPDYKFQDIETNLKSIDLVYKLNQDLLKELKLKKLPDIVQYGSEDFTRGIRGFLDSRYKHLPIKLSNGFVKLWEILHTFKLMKKTDANNTTSSTFNVFHIAEAPGQMILCAKYYAERKHKTITNYEWRANSLRYGGLKDDYKLIRNNPDKWLWGADNSGDITKVNNIKWFRKYINTKWINHTKTNMNTNSDKLDLIIGDGGLSADTNSAYILQKLDLAQVITVIASSCIGGSCVIKHFTSYMINKPETLEATSFFISFIYLYYIYFEEVNLFKPYTSDSTSGEFYVIGKGFKGIEDKDLDTLYSILSKFKTNYAIFPKNALPESFIKQIANFLDLLTKYNIKGYEKQNLLLKCYKLEMKNKMKSKSKNKSKKTTLQNNQNNENNINTNDCQILNNKNIEHILIPRYNQWIKINEFE
jgi:hypothetical protein